MRLVKLLVTAALALSLDAMAGTAEVVAVVSAKSSVTTLTRNQVTDIFLGKTSRFPDGSQAMPIDQSEGSITRDEFYATFANKTPAQVKAHWSKIIFTGRGRPPPEMQPAELKKFLANNPGAIGYLDGSAVDTMLKAVKINP